MESKKKEKLRKMDRYSSLKGMRQVVYNLWNMEMSILREDIIICYKESSEVFLVMFPFHLFIRYFHLHKDEHGIIVSLEMPFTDSCNAQPGYIRSCWNLTVSYYQWPICLDNLWCTGWKLLHLSKCGSQSCSWICCRECSLQLVQRTYACSLCSVLLGLWRICSCWLISWDWEAA